METDYTCIMIYNLNNISLSEKFDTVYIDLPQTALKLVTLI